MFPKAQAVGASRPSLGGEMCLKTLWAGGAMPRSVSRAFNNWRGNMNFGKIAAALAVGAALTLGMAAPSVAVAPSPVAENSGKADSGDRARDAKARKGPVMALHKGKSIDLAKGWGTATVCTEYADLTVRCFDTDAEAEEDLAKFKAQNPGTLKAPPAGRGDMKKNSQGKMETVPAASAGTQSAASVSASSPGCSWGFTCVYEHLYYEGRKLQWDLDGTKTLGQYGFRDQTTSVANNDEMGGMTLIDYRDNMVDPTFIVCLGCAHGDLRQHDYPGWGTGSWGDRADALTM